MISLKRKTYRIIGFSFLVAALTSIACVGIGTLIQRHNKLNLLGESMVLSSQNQLAFIIPGLLVQEEFGSVKSRLTEIKIKEKLTNVEVIPKSSKSIPGDLSGCQGKPGEIIICSDPTSRLVTTFVPIILSTKKLGTLLKQRKMSTDELPIEFFWPITILVGGFLLAFGIISLWMGLFLQNDIRHPLNTLAEILIPILQNKQGARMPRFNLLEIQTLASRVEGLVKDFEERQVNAAIAETTQMLAHDVKRPFVLLRTGLAAIQDETETERVKELAAILIPEVEKSLANVEGLVSNISEIGARNHYVIESVSIKDLIHTSIEQVFSMHKETNIEFRYQWNHTRKIGVDSMRTPRIFTNILENAVEAMSGRGEISFETSEIEEEGKPFLKITIANNNSEINEENISRVFDKFFTTGKRRGTGLGLAIVRKLVNDFGGKTWCTSQYRTVQFHLTLPLVDDSEDSASLVFPSNSGDFKR